MQSVQINGATVWYEVVGQGPDLVLVSGTGGNMHSNWDHLLPQFSKSRRVLLVDYSGSGKTLDSHPRLTVEILAEQVLAAAQAAGMERFDLVGYSLGTCVSMYIATMYPEKMRSLVLLAGFSDGTDSRNVLQTTLWQELIARDPALFARMIVLNGMSPTTVASMTQAQIDAWVQAICQNNDWHGIWRQIDLDRRVNVSSLLKDIKAPTLVIGCLQDQVIPIEHARKLASDIAGATYAELDAGHLAPFEKSTEFGEMVTTFLNKNSPV